MSLPIAITPKALSESDAAQYLGISQRQLKSRVKAAKIRRQPDGAFSIKHLDEYQRAQEAAAECKVIEINGKMGSEEESLDSDEANPGESKVVFGSDRRRGRRGGGIVESISYPDL